MSLKKPKASSTDDDMAKIKDPFQSFAPQEEELAQLCIRVPESLKVEFQALAHAKNLSMNQAGLVAIRHLIDSSKKR